LRTLKVGSTELPENVTELLKAWGDGDREALDRLVPLVYAELRRRAAAQLARERGSHTLQPTALVHEAFLRLVDQHSARWENRAQFFGVAAQLMRRILVDHARARAAAKRGGGALSISLDEAGEGPASPEADVLHLHQALERLAVQDERQARVVELRYFGGLSTEEVSTVLAVSEITVKRDWAMAKAWLYRELSGGPPGAAAPPSP
jgi:RNA polymerase sigma factor (TIGR02999 family)